jgi:hypothetical protein
MSQPEATNNPCVTCGACCTIGYLVVVQPDDPHFFPKGPENRALTVPFIGGQRLMRRVGTKMRRCAALKGEPGKQVGCGIYDRRPQCCRDFPVWEEDGRPNPECTAARKTIGLKPLPRLKREMHHGDQEAAEG